MARTRWPPGSVNPGLLHRTGRSPELAAAAVLPAPRQWRQIWPAIGTRDWPPAPLEPVLGISPFGVGLRDTAAQAS
jgi:hypothetical protein